MNAVGIDVSKGKSMVAILRPFGEIVAKPFEVSHNSIDINDLIRLIKQLSGDTKIVMEHTGKYYESIAYMLASANLFVCPVNPKLIRDFSTNSLRKVKTDKADAIKIARYALDNWTELRPLSSCDETRYQLKSMNRQFSFYMKEKTALKNNLISLLDQTFPDANKFFESRARIDGHQKWVDFVSSYWHVDCIRKMTLSAFTEHYKKWCHKNGYNYQSKKPVFIYDKAKHLIPLLPKNNTTKVLIHQAVLQLNSVSKLVESLRSQMNQLASSLPEYPVVMSLVGVGPSLGPQLIAEIGDINRFSHRSALTAFAGVDPGANQSGQYEQHSVRTSKRGSPLLRKTLFQIMTSLIKSSPENDPVYNFMDKKRSQGKPYYVYMTAGANKFLRIYYGRVKEYLTNQR